MLAAFLLLSSAARAQEPDNVDKAHAAYAAGYAALQEQHLEVAQREFAAMVRLAPQLPEGHNALGFVLLQTGHASEAAAEFEKALALQPSKATRETLAQAYAQMHEEKKALAMLADAAREGALSPAAAVLDARLLSAAGREDDAVLELRRSLEAAGDASALPQSSRAELAQAEDSLGTILARKQLSGEKQQTPDKQQPSEAQQNFQSAIALDGTSAAPELHLGALLMAEGEMDAALPHLQRAVELAPEDASARMQLGMALSVMHRDDEALAALRRAEELTQRDGTPAEVRTEAQYQLALALQNTKAPGDSIPYFEKVVAAQPERADALTNLGLAMVQTGKSKEATQYYLRALKLAPNNVTLRTGLGVDYLQQSDLDGAIQQFRAGLALEPDSPLLHYDLGLALKLKDQLDLAVPELEKAMQLDPSLMDPHFTLGTLYMQQGKFEEAATEMRAVLAAQPDNGDLWATLGSVYKQAGKPAEAIDALQKAIALLPAQPGPHITLAGILLEQGKTEDAAAERKLAGSLTRGAMNKQAALFATNAGDLLLSKGQMDEAIAQYRTAIKDDAQYAPAHRQLAIALEQKGQKAEADVERKIAEQIAAAEGKS